MRFICLWFAAAAALAHPSLPVFFEPNKGQAPAVAQYVARTAGYSIFLTSGGAIFSTQGQDVVRLGLPGARSTVPEALEPLPGRSHYLTGSKPDQWVTGIRQFSRIRYPKIYPGIDLVYYGRDGRLEHDFIVQPGADPSKIRFSIEGPNPPRLDSKGNLVIDTAIGSLTLQAPTIYQDTASGRRPVSGGFLADGRHFRLEVRQWDRSLPLVIDPVILYTQVIKGSGTGYFSRIAADGAGNIYLAGGTNSTNLVHTGYQKVPAGNFDAWLVKLDAAGTVIYSTLLGGSGSEYTRGLGVAPDGAVLVAGSTTSVDFPVTAKANQPQKGTGQDCFVTRLNANGDGLVYSTFHGGNGTDSLSSMALDRNGHAFITGLTTSSNFPATQGALFSTRAGTQDAFVSRFTPGGLLVYSTYLGGSGVDAGNAIAVPANSTGYAYVTGYTGSTDFPLSATAYQSMNKGQADAFLAVLASDGRGLVFSTYFGGQSNDRGYSIALGSDSSVFLSGDTSSTNFPTLPPNPAAPPAGSSVPFVAHFQLTGLTPELQPAGGPVDTSSAKSSARASGSSVHLSLQSSTAINSYPGSVSNIHTVQNLIGKTTAIRGVHTNSMTQDTGSTSTFEFDLQTLQALMVPSGFFYISDTLGTGDSEMFCGNDFQTFQAMYGGMPTPATQTPSSENSGVAGEPVSTATGELFETETDFRLGGPHPLSFARYYSSKLSGAGFTSSLGTNWMHNLETKLVQYGTRYSILLFKGQTVGFELTPAGFQPAGTHPVHYQLVALADGFKFAEPMSGRMFTFDTSGALLRIEDRNGNTLHVTPSPEGPIFVRDDFGRSLTFSYSGQKLIAIEDQVGRRVLFQYSGDDLAAAIDPAGNTTEYAYTAGRMTARLRPAGNTPFTQTFDADGRVVTQSDSQGNRTDFEYNTPTLNTTTIREPLDVTYRHTHAARNNLTSVQDPAGSRSTYAFDSAVRRTSDTDRLNRTSSLTYHSASGLPQSYTDAEGHTTRYTYTPQAQSYFTFYNLTGISYPDGTSASYEYDTAGNPVAVTDGSGRISRTEYSPRGLPLTMTNTAGGVTTITYNGDATRASIESPTGDTTRFEYDDFKRLSRVIHPDETTIEFQWDFSDNLVRLVDEGGRERLYEYDANGRIATYTDPAGSKVTYAYNDDDRLVSVTDRTGNTQSVSYDARGRVKTRNSAAGWRLSAEYNALDHLVSLSDEVGTLIETTYDAEGVPATRKDTMGRTWRFRTDKLRRTVEATDPSDRVYKYAYDPMGRLASTTAPLNRVTLFGYESRGMLSWLHLPGGVEAAYEYDDLGLISTITDPNGSQWLHGYDAAGRLTASADPLGRVVSAVYDSRDRINGIETPEGAVEIQYNAAGSPIRRVFSDGTDLSYAYDARNRLVESSNLSLAYDANGRLNSSNGIAIGRDADGRITSMTLAPDKTITYGYGPNGLLTTITDWLGGATELRYNNARQVTWILRPNWVVSEFFYDAGGNLSGIKEWRTDTMSSISLTRDGAGRIISADREMPLSPTPSAEPGEQVFAYDAAHQIDGASYDGLGRTTAHDARAFAWDGASRLQSITSAGGTITYERDGLGLMAGRRNQSFVLNYALGLPSVSIVREDGQDVRYYVHLPNGFLLHSMGPDGPRCFYHFDEQGNTTMLTNEEGSITDTYAITPFGESVTHQGETDNPFTFQGAFGVMQEGSTGTYAMRARHYDSRSGRFLTPDPVPSLDPRNLNRYQYAFNNPLQFTDPTGRSPEPIATLFAFLLIAQTLNDIFLKDWVGIGPPRGPLPSFWFPGVGMPEPSQAWSDPGEPTIALYRDVPEVPSKGGLPGLNPTRPQTGGATGTRRTTTLPGSTTPFDFACHPLGFHEFFSHFNTKEKPGIQRQPEEARENLLKVFESCPNGNVFIEAAGDYYTFDTSRLGWIR